MGTAKKNILIVEDHDSIRLLLGAMLGKTYSVTTKKDGWAGMKWLGEGNIPDLILLDRQMPRLAGDEFLHQLKCSGFYRHIPVIILSGEEENQHIEECMVMGAADYITKPFNPAKLNERIQSVLHTTDYIPPQNLPTSIH